MHESGAQTKPRVPADWIEWAFVPGDPAVVVAVPSDDGDLSLYRLDHAAPDNLREREFVRALLRIAERVMADSEPVNPNGARR